MCIGQELRLIDGYELMIITTFLTIQNIRLRIGLLSNDFILAVFSEVINNSFLQITKSHSYPVSPETCWK